MTVSTIRLVSMLTLLALGSAAYAGGPDTDGDGIDDAFDNCINVFNPAQRDTDGDGFGNYCDFDLNNDGIVNFPDLGIFKDGIFGTDPNLDFDGDGNVNFADLQLMKGGFFGPPGPSAPNTAPTGLAIDNNSVDENQAAGTAVGTFSTTDPNPGNTHTYTLVAGGGDTDNAQFTIVGDVLQTAAVLNHEAADNCVTSADTCSIRVQTEDNLGGTFQRSFVIDINDVNEAPDITSNGGGANASVNVDENQTAVTTVTATDVDLPAQNLTFSISGGPDQLLFGISATTGELTFNSAPDFENPQDAGGDNTYDVQVTVTDDGAPNLSDSQDIAVTVNDLSENFAPEITSDGGGASASLNVDENQTAVTTVTATDADVPAQNLTFSISGGADQLLFGINGTTGVLTFNSAPDFENPQDAGGDNIYDVQVTVTDDGAPNLSDSQDIAVTVDDLNEAPVITSDGGGATAAVNAPENQTAVTTVTATDEDLPAQNLTFSISGGADQLLFGISGTTGELTFNSAPNFENPQDAGGDNTYDVQVTVTDDGAPNLSDSQDIAVTVDDLNEAPEITSDGGGASASLNVDENQTAVTTVTATDADVPAQNLTFSISGGADQLLFGINGTTGVLTFNSAPDFENPQDAGGDNTYDVQVTVTDDGAPNLSDSQDIAVTVDDLNEAPVITSDGGGATAAVNAPENQTAVTTVTATDEDLPAQNLTFSISGGADQLLFGINGTTGVLTFNSAPDFENPEDAGGDNTYDVQVTVTDDGAPNLSDTQDIAVTVTDEFEPNQPPVGGADAFDFVGNTLLGVDAAVSGANISVSTTGGTTPAADGVLDNDTDPDTDPLSVAGIVSCGDVIAPFDCPTTNSGTVSMAADGTFTFVPAAGDTNASDSFQYILDDSTATVDVSVTLTRFNEIWYVDNTNASGTDDGTSVDPFGTLAEAATASGTGDTIFIYTGDGGTTGQNAGITLDNSERLIGQGVALTVPDTLNGVAMPTLLPAGGRPEIAGNPAVTLNSGNTVRGLDISGMSGIAGSNFGTLTADSVSISVTNGPGIDLTNGAGSATFDSVSSAGGSGSGIDLDSVTGFFAFGSGSISASTGPAIDITNSSATIGYGGSVTAGGNLAVNISGQSASSVSLSGLISSTGQGILLNSNTGGTINLSGGMSLSTGAFSAFSATNGGTVNVTGTNDVTTTTASAVIVSSTTIGASGMTFESIDSTSPGSNAGIVLNNTGSGTFDVTGTGGTCATGTATCTGGTIANKTGDAITLNDTGGRVTLTAMRIEDIGSTGGGFNTRSQHDAIHGEDVLGGLTLNNVLIRRISDMCINGATFGGAFPGLGATSWNGLDIANSTIEDCNRWHVAGVADTSDEGAVRIVGLTGTVTVDNSTIQRGGELMDLFTAPTGTLNMTVTDSDFIDAFKEFNSGPVVATGKTCIDVTVEGSSDANVTIGGAGAFPNNEFINCGTASVRVAKDTVPAGNSDIDVIVNNNQFRVTDQTPANGIFGNTPQGGVVLRAGPGGIDTFDGLVSNNVFGVAVGPDDDIGSTTDEVGNADGVEGNLALIFEEGVSQARVNNNTFNGSINAPWFNRGDGNASAAVLYVNNSYRGRADYCCDGGFTFRVPGVPYRTRVRNGGNLDITFRNDSFAVHDQFFFAQTENLELESPNVGGGGTMKVCLDNVTAPDGFEFDEDAGSISLYQGANNAAATGPCGVEADGHAVSDCELEVADDGVRGGPAGHAQSGAPTPGLNPPHIDVDGGSISITSTACNEPSGGIF